jgi:hypothetical protein
MTFDATLIAQALIIDELHTLAELPGIDLERYHEDEVPGEECAIIVEAIGQKIRS